jgi:hypothetical protein
MDACWVGGDRRPRTLCGGDVSCRTDAHRIGWVHAVPRTGPALWWCPDAGAPWVPRLGEYRGVLVRRRCAYQPRSLSSCADAEAHALLGFCLPVGIRPGIQGIIEG